jgi:hypothetical protein
MNAAATISPYFGRGGALRTDSRRVDPAIESAMKWLISMM